MVGYNLRSYLVCINLDLCKYLLKEFLIHKNSQKSEWISHENRYSVSELSHRFRG